MLGDFYDALKKAGFRRNLSFQAIMSLVGKLSPAEKIDFALRLNEEISYGEKKAASRFEFITNSTLAGGPDPCGDEACRIQHIEETAIFSALYGDRVLIPNPLDRYIANYTDRREEIQNREISIAIYIYNKMKPLLESGLMELASSEHYNFCLNCYAENIASLSENSKQQLFKLIDALNDGYKKNIQFEVLQEDLIAVTGSDEYIPHGKIYVEYDNDATLRSVIHRHRAKIPFQLSTYQVKKWGLVEEFSAPVRSDLIRQNYYCSKFNTSYLTDRSLDIQLIRSGQHSPIFDGFSHIAPVVTRTSLENLIKLRRSEPEAFKNYQNATAKAAEEAAENSTKSFDIYNDVIAPEVNALQVKMKKSRKIFSNNLYSDAVLAGASVGFGIFNGVLPPNIGAMISALGGFHYGKDVIKNIRGLLSDEAIRDEKFYFLWRANKHLSLK